MRDPPGSVRGGGLSMRCWGPLPAGPGAGVASAAGASVGSSSSARSSSSSLRVASWAGGGASVVPLAVWRACRLVRCSGSE